MNSSLLDLLALNLYGNKANIILPPNIANHLVQHKICICIRCNRYITCQEDHPNSNGPYVQLMNRHHALHFTEALLQPCGVNLPWRASAIFMSQTNIYVSNHTNMKFNNIKKIQSRSECLSPCAAVHMYAPQTNYWVMGYAYGSTKMHVLILSNHA